MEAGEKTTTTNQTRIKPGAGQALETPRGTAEQPRAKRLGTVLKGRYRIQSLIASGGTSDVYKAVDLYLEKAGARDSLVAIKLLRTELTRDADALALLARETAKSRRLSHPNIIRVQDLDHDGKTWFMVMELLDGEPLSRVIQRAKPRGLQWSGARAVLEQVVSALAYSHRHGVIHADLKPANIFLTRDGDIKLLDFGVAHALKPQQPTDFLHPSGEDETTVYGYTPAYASPALIAGAEPEVADDLYALACISYELLTSRHPFDRKKMDQSERAQAALRRPGGMPRRLWRITAALLRGQQRPVSLSTFSKALQPIRWRRAAAMSGLAGLVALAGLQAHHSRDQLQQLENRLAHHQQRAGLLDSLAGQPPADLLAALPELEPVERAGLLNMHRERILSHFRREVERTLQETQRPDLPNLPGALAILAQALEFYPDHSQLLQLSERLHQQSRSLHAALEEELNGRLEQGNYQSFEALEELETLAADLNFLSSQPLEGSERALAVLSDQLETALARDDGPALARLVTVAGHFFEDSETVGELLSEAREKQTAIMQLGDYHRRLAAGETPRFPEDAARQFYGSRVAGWQEIISAATSPRELDRVYNELQHQSENVPPGFTLFADVRRALADAYISQADRLLARSRAQQAQPLLQKATRLMRQQAGS